MHFATVMVCSKYFIDSKIQAIVQIHAKVGFYFSALCEKEEVMESHLYECMAHMGLTHNFMWSRWNGQLNSRSMVLLVRELIEKKKTVMRNTIESS